MVCICCLKGFVRVGGVGRRCLVCPREPSSPVRSQTGRVFLQLSRPRRHMPRANGGFGGMGARCRQTRAGGRGRPRSRADSEIEACQKLRGAPPTGEQTGDAPTPSPPENAGEARSDTQSRLGEKPAAGQAIALGRRGRLFRATCAGDRTGYRCRAVEWPYSSALPRSPRPRVGDRGRRRPAVKGWARIE